MNDEQKDFLETMHAFGKLNFGLLMPKMNPGDARLLSIIGRYYDRHPEGTMKVSDLVRRMPAPPPAISRGLKCLEGKGYIQRVTDPKDRRNTLVYMTDEGRKCSDEINHTMMEYFDAIFARMDKLDLASMTVLMRKMLNIAEEELDARLAARNQESNSAGRTSSRGTAFAPNTNTAPGKDTANTDNGGNKIDD
ncbi:MAG: MarR family transcriptional regulator [Clostridiales bacterium]|nr:MarR family transcriptional regulator [Clostridiales bacterium]